MILSAELNTVFFLKNTNKIKSLVLYPLTYNGLRAYLSLLQLEWDAVQANIAIKDPAS